MQNQAVLPEWFSRLERGPDGEVYPPALIDGLSPDEALDLLEAANKRLGQPIRVPQKGEARKGLINVALLYVHQMRLREALAGQRADDPISQALQVAVLGGGVLISLRPPSLEALSFGTFAPVFQCLTPSAQNGAVLQWRVGVPGRGQVEEYAEPDAGKALARAQRRFVEWSAADDAAFDEQAKQALKALPASLFHDYWLSVIDERESWDFGGGYRLSMLGRHTTMQLDTPTGTRILETERGRAVRLADALARQAGVIPDWPAPLHLRTWLGEEGAVEPEQVAWGKGAGGLPARVLAGGKEYALVKRGQALLLHEVKNGQYVAKLAETVIEPPLAAWLEQGDADGRLAVVTWAVWKGSGHA